MDNNGFQLVTVTAVSPAWSTPIDLGLRGPGVGHLRLYNKASSSTSVVEFSFDGSTPHGEMDPSDDTRGFTDDDRRCDGICFRIKSGSSGPVTVFVQGWLSS